MSPLLFGDRPQFTSRVQPTNPLPPESNDSLRIPAAPEAGDVDAGVAHRLRNLQCLLANAVGLEYCMCHGGFTRESRMATDFDGLCIKCAAFVRMDRLAAKIGLR